MSGLAPGQKIDFGKGTGVEVSVEGKAQPLAGTYLVASTSPTPDAASGTGGRVELMDVVDRKPVQSTPGSSTPPRRRTWM